MYVGIDVGGTNLKAGLVDEMGRILAVERTPLDFRGPEAFAATLAELSRAVMDAGGAETSQVEYVGVGLPGAVSGGDVVYTTNIPMENVPLEALFRHTLDLPLLLGNDADCAAVGEFFCGAGQGTRDFVVVTLGTGIGDEFDISKVRYHKIFIMADADVDGSHICTLMLTFFFRYMRPLIDHGYVYVAQPPLFKLQKGQTVKYAYNDDEMKLLSAEMPGAKVNRYKGLGEMNPDQLWETTMNPDNRVIVQIKIEDAERADEAFSILMGEQVEPRRQFIEKNAKYANLDV